MNPPVEPARVLGSTGIPVSAITLGTSAVGNATKVTDDQADMIIERASTSPITVIDTSSNYGISEQRVGRALRRIGGLPAGHLLVTKVDPLPDSDDFSGARVHASVRESLQRLGVDRLELVHLHDPERISFDEGVAPGGPVAALVDLRARGLVEHLGVAGGPVGLLQRYLDTGEFEVVLSHNRYTLLDRSAEALFRSAADRGFGVLNAAPYGGGMLSKGPKVQQTYAYGTRDDGIRQAALSMEAACRRYEVPLAAAALQFSLRSELIASTVVGMSSPERLAQTLELAAVTIPDDLWSELDQHTPARDLWLD